jgi:hypothetical protein
MDYFNKLLSRTFTKSQIYKLKLFWGVVNLIFGLLGLYLVYRWGVALLAGDDTNRKILVGEPLYTWFSNNEKVFLVLAAIYLAFRLISIVVTTIQWEQDMSRSRRGLKKIARKQLYVRTYSSS